MGLSAILADYDILVTYEHWSVAYKENIFFFFGWGATMGKITNLNNFINNYNLFICYTSIYSVYLLENLGRAPAH